MSQINGENAQSATNYLSFCFVAHQASFQNLIQEVEISYLSAKSASKDFIVIEGSMTSIGACANCARPAAEYSNARKNFFDYAAKWINERF